jgi:hypothetical protein
MEASDVVAGRFVLGISLWISWGLLSLAVDRLWTVICSPMAQERTSGRVEMLLEAGVPREMSYELAQDYDAERITQAIQLFHKANETHNYPPTFIVKCLREDWLAFLLFEGKQVPPDTLSRERLSNLRLAKKDDYIRQVEICVKKLARYEWEYLAGEAVRDENHFAVDDYYKCTMFRNPTQSNWILCEKVEALHRWGYLDGKGFQAYLEMRRGVHKR